MGGDFERRFWEILGGNFWGAGILRNIIYTRNLRNMANDMGNNFGGDFGGYLVGDFVGRFCGDFGGRY